MHYRFPSAMGEAEAAGAHVAPEYVMEVVDEVEKLLLTPPPHKLQYVDMIRKAINAGAVELILMAAEKCPSGDYILHHADGRIVRDIKELEE